MHEIDPTYMGLAAESDSRQTLDVARWRKAERARLIAERMGAGSNVRNTASEKIVERLLDVVVDVRDLTVSICWPFKGEPDLREIVRPVMARGGRGALPVVIGHRQPLIFRSWAFGDRLEPGVWSIPTPVNGVEVAPDIVIAPVVGFDAHCFRLGYGGGFFDRTLASMKVAPRIIGVSYSAAQIPTIYPQWHDVPMDMIVTEAGIVRPSRAA